MSAAKILAFAGSARKDSFNKKLVKIAAEGAKKAGADVTLIDLKDYPMPIFDEDLEAEIGIDPNARKLKDVFSQHNGLLIAAPEYNSSITPLLKNTIDWVSRPEPDKEGKYYLAGKYAAIMSAAPGPLGGIRGLVVVRMLLGNIQVTTIPDQVCISNAGDAFDSTGNLKDPGQQESIESIGMKLVSVLDKQFD